MEGAAGPPRGAGDALAGLGAGATAQKGAAAAVPDVVLEVYLEHLLIMKKDELRVNSPMSRLHTNVASREPRALIPEFQCMYKLGGAVQAIIPEFPSPEIAHETARNL